MRKIKGGHGEVAKEFLTDLCVPLEAKGMYAYLAEYEGIRMNVIQVEREFVKNLGYRKTGCINT